MSLETNEQLIIQTINQRKQRLKTLLQKCYDTSTNELFDIDSNASLTDLCTLATRIQTTRDNQPNYPPSPTIKTNTICEKQLTIYNKIQYCNNLLRYALKRNGVEVGNINKTENLITLLEGLCSIQKMDIYISDINLLSNGNLKLTYHEYINSEADMITNISDLNSNQDFTVTKEPFSRHALVYYYLEFNKNKDLRAKSYTIERNTYIASNQQELLCLLQTIQDGQTIYIKEGTYTLPQQYNIKNCNIIGEKRETTILKNYGLVFNSDSHTNIEIHDVTFNGNLINLQGNGVINYNVDADMYIHDCIFKNIMGQTVKLLRTPSNYSLEVSNCQFEGAPNYLISYDNGILSDYNDIWSTSTTSSNIIVTRKNEYTEFREATNRTYFNQTDNLTDSCIIEFDYYQVDGNNRDNFFYITDNTDTPIHNDDINLNYINGETETWYHLKIILQNYTMTLINENNGTLITRNISSTPSVFGFYSGQDITTIRFKNFKIYDLIS